MKKMCMFVMSVFAVHSMFPAYATTDIAADAESSECVENITGTYSGDANFKAKWAPNNIQLRWYNNNSEIESPDITTNTCDYGGALTLPNITPERIGYIFDGWKVRPTMDFSTLSSRGHVGYSKNSSDECYYTAGSNTSQVSCNSDINFAELEPGEWKATNRYNLNTLYGQAYCSKKQGSAFGWVMSHISTWQVADKSTLENYQSQSENKYCWCKVTGYKPASSDIVYGSLYTLGWITVSDFGDYNCLTSVCVTRCVYGVNSGIVPFHTALFLPVQNVE